MKNSNPLFVFAHDKPWGESIFNRFHETRSSTEIWQFVHTGQQLESVLDNEPKYIFFLHWSRIVPDELTSEYECICFHMTDLPYGRGGSPLQNLILNKFDSTKLSAFRMTNVLDGGPIYWQSDLDLSGKAGDIYLRAADLCLYGVDFIVKNSPIPIEQVGEPFYFKRRTPDQSRVPNGIQGKDLYDFIRMLDADGYPKAYISENGMKISLTDAKLEDDVVTATARIDVLEA